MIQSQYNYPNIVCAVAIPIAVAAVSTATAVASISAQNKQANIQASAIKKQQEISNANVDLRLMELERQKLYGQFQSQLNEVARRNDRAFQESDLQLQKQQTLLNRQLQQVNFAQQRAQLSNQVSLKEGELSEAEAANQLSRGNRDLAILDNFANASIGANNQLLGAEQEGANIVQQIVSQLRQGTAQQNQNLRGMEGLKNQMSGASPQGLSASDTALMQGNLDEMSINQGQQQLDVGSLLDMVGINAENAEVLRNYLMGQAIDDTILGTALSGAEFASAKRQIDQERLLSRLMSDVTGRGIGLDETLATTQSYQDEQALQILDMAQRNRFDLESMASVLNDKFYDTALQSQRLTTQLAGASEMASLQAQRASIQRPSGFSVVGALAQGAQGIYNAIPRNNTAMSTGFSFGSAMPAYNASQGSQAFNTNTASFSGFTSLPTFR